MAVLAPDDLRDTLMAHAHDLCNGLHRKAVVVGRPDGPVTLAPQCFACPLQRGFAPRVVLGEGSQTGSDLGGLAFRAGDLRIV